MAKLNSGRVIRTPQSDITSDRYQFLGLEQAEPNLGDPLIGPSSITANPIPVGTPYQLIAVDGADGQRFWAQGVGIGSTLGYISVYDNGILPNNQFNAIHGINFVGGGVTVTVPAIGGPTAGVGIATVLIAVDELLNQGQSGEVITNSPTGFATGNRNLFWNYTDNSLGINTTIPTSNLYVVGTGEFSGIVTAPIFEGTLIGIATTAQNLTNAANIGTGFLSTDRFDPSDFYPITVSKALFAPKTSTAETATNVIGGIGSITNLVVSGISSVVGVGSTVGFILEGYLSNDAQDINAQTFGSIGTTGDVLMSTFDPVARTGYGVTWVPVEEAALFGRQGIQGTQGIQGSIGPQGSQGIIGSQGPQGIQGSIGPQGSQGIQGISGFIGAQGPQGIQGFQGIQGIQGTIGPQGAQGTQGSIGSQGPQGIQGFQGTSGVVGGAGPQGPQGPQGTQGSIGPQGSQGTTGNIGSIGPQGAQGTQGAIGPQGSQGAIGPQGSQGTTGSQGPQGVSGTIGGVGAQGPQGTEGPIGPQGTQGAIGPQGSQGAIGPQGSQGAQGITGEQGVQGRQGRQGTQGTFGPQGPIGPQGAQGTQGNLGPQGTDGPQGTTGNQGTTGSIGPQGAQGRQGITGPLGPQGTTGSLGPQGAQGTQGRQGRQGIQGTFGPATIPQNPQNASTTYTLVANDNGKHVLIGGTTTTVSIPVSIFTAGDNIVVVNDTGSSINITQSTGNLRLAGTNLTGNRQLIRFGVCTLLCTVGGASPTFYISGSGVV